MGTARLLYARLRHVAPAALVLLATSPCGGADLPHAPGPAGKAASPTASLDLSLGDVTRYFDAAELATPLPQAVLEEIIVNGERPEPLPERRVIPQALGALIYAATNPLDAWRILVPDPNFEIPERSEDDTRDPPGAFRGRILEPGAIYD
jgi:hypothetical protein